MTALRAYYAKEWPAPALHAMLAMNGAGNAEQRGVSLQYAGNSNVYAKPELARATADELRATVVREGGESLHMGATELAPGEARYGQAVRKELVLDVDATDYRRFCDCTKGVCAFCWALHITGTYLILHHTLTAKLGYRDAQLLWVYSGGKGMHCFVNARQVLRMSDTERARLFQLFHCALDDYSESQSYDHQKLVALIGDYVQNHAAFLERLEQHWVSAVLRQRDALCNERLRAYFMELLGRYFPVFLQPVRLAWSQWEAGQRVKRARCDQERNESEALWDLLQRVELQVSNSGDAVAVRPSHYLMLRVLYPQVDQGPLRLQHRIKLPFSVHGTTQRLALPMQGDALQRMDPARDALSFQELSLSRVTPQKFTAGVALLEQWITQYDTV